MTDPRARGVFYTDGTNSLPGGTEAELARAYGYENVVPLAEVEVSPLATEPVERVAEVGIDIADDATDEQIFAALRVAAPAEAPDEAIWDAVRDIRAQMPQVAEVVAASTDSVQVTEGMTIDDVLEQLGEPVLTVETETEKVVPKKKAPNAKNLRMTN